MSIIFDSEEIDYKLEFVRQIAPMVCLTLGSNKSLHTYIDRVYSKKESEYAGKFYESKLFDRLLTNCATYATQLRINKVADIMAYDLVNYDGLPTIYSLISKGYRLMCEYVKAGKDLDYDSYTNAIYSRKGNSTIYALSQVERAECLYLLVLVEHRKEVNPEVWQSLLDKIDTLTDYLGTDPTFQKDLVRSALTIGGVSIGDSLDTMWPFPDKSLTYDTYLRHRPRVQAGLKASSDGNLKTHLTEYVSVASNNAEDILLHSIIDSLSPMFGVHLTNFFRTIEVTKDDIKDLCVLYEASAKTRHRFRKNISLEMYVTVMLMIKGLADELGFTSSEAIKLKSSLEKALAVNESADKKIVSDSEDKLRIQQLEQQLADARTEVARLERKSSKLEKEVDSRESHVRELAGLRSYVHRESVSVDQNEDSLSEESVILAKLSKLKMVMAGGHYILTNKMRDKLSNLRVLETKTTASFPKDCVSNCDVLLVVTSHISHAVYGQLMYQVERGNVQVVFIDEHVNVKLILNKIYEDLVSTGLLT